MNQIMKAAADLADEMERQGRSEAVVYFLNDGNFFHPLLEAVECTEVLTNIEGDVDMAIGKFTLNQLKLLGAAAK